MSTKIELKDFELQKIKVSEKSIHIQYFNAKNRNDLVTIDSDSKPSEDLFNKVNLLSEVFAQSLGLLRGWEHSRDYIKKNDEALKIAMNEYQSEIDRCKVSGFSLVGGEGNEGVKITGSLETDYGKIGIPSGIIKFDDVDLGAKSETIIEQITSEVYLFLFKGKRDNDLFNQKSKPQSSETEGLGTSTLKAV